MNKGSCEHIRLEILSVMSRNNVSVQDIADKLEWKPSKVKRLINDPGRMTIENMSDIAFAIGGKWDVEVIKLPEGFRNE